MAPSSGRATAGRGANAHSDTSAPHSSSPRGRSRAARARSARSDDILLQLCGPLDRFGQGRAVARYKCTGITCSARQEPAGTGTGLSRGAQSSGRRQATSANDILTDADVGTAGGQITDETQKQLSYVATGRRTGRDRPLRPCWTSTGSQRVGPSPGPTELPARSAGLAC